MSIIPFNSYSDYIRQKYGERIQKITVLGGFTCPNRDGTKGIGGCTYCNNQSFAPPDFLASMSITEQIAHGIETSKRLYKNVKKFIVYFQSYSNTYAPLPKLRALYEEALAYPGVIGLSIGTRPDCLSEEILQYLSELMKRAEISIELGLESISDQTLQKINRGHNYQDFSSAVERLAHYQLETCVHIILGFPWEDGDHPIKSAQFLSKLPIHSLKVHQLQIVKETAMAKEYGENPFKLFTLEEYMEALRAFLEHLNPGIIIQRFYGETPPELLVAPQWNLRVSAFSEMFVKYMNKKQSKQGLKF